MSHTESNSKSTINTINLFEIYHEDEAIRRDIYKRILNMFINFNGTLCEIMEKYGMSARDLFYKSDISSLMLDVADKKKTMDFAKDWLRGYVIVAYKRYIEDKNVSK
jgi:hypothetical protein